MPLARHNHIATQIEEIREKHQDRGQNGGGGLIGIKVNFYNMVQELRNFVDQNSESEKSFIGKLLKSKMPSRNDVSSIKTNEVFINCIMKNMTKSIVYLYKNIDVTIDEYLASEEDKFVMEDAEGIVRRQPHSGERVDAYQGR
tara:strand:- start:424 stop:852 length:429 start_codon:yes stop_codon:yes gene_type:complete